MKKVLAMVLAVLMLVSVLCVGVSADADESAFAFVADSVSALAGQTVDVTIRTQNNPGIVGLRVTLGYDESVLTPVEMVAQDFATASFGPLSNPLSTTWVDAINPNNTTDGVIAKITFQVAADAPVGEYPLTVGIVDSEDIFDSDFNVVPVTTINGAVNVLSYTPGDVNNDGKINVKDLGLLQQYLNGWDVVIVDAAADVTGDGKINVKDLGLLQQYLNGWDVSLGGGTVTPPDQPGDEPEPPKNTLTIEEAIAMGSAMEHNVYTEDKYYVTGIITEVYNTMYGNMRLTDEAGNILTIYGTYSADGELRYDAMEVKPVAGDTVTIYGIVGQYNGTPQIKNGWIVEHIPGEGGDDDGDEPVDPPVGDTLSIADAIAIGSSMAHNTYTEEKYYVTGVITEVYNTQYGNMKIADEAGNILTIYGTYSADGELRYDAMEVKPVAGDTVTIYGIVGQYNDTPQIKNGWITEHIPGEGGEPVDPPVEPVDGVVIDFTDKANRTFYSAEQQVWAQNGITVTNDKGASTSNVGDYGGDGYPARFYKSSTVTIEYPGMSQLVIDCSGLESKYVNGWVDSITDANATGTVAGTTVTIVFAKAVDSFTWETLSAQSRANSITVVGEGGDIGGGDEPVVPPVDPEPEDPDEPDEPVGDSATIDFTDKANRVSYSTEQQVWAQNGITVTNDKAASTSNVGDYGGEGYPVRFYKSSSVLVEYKGMTKVVFYCDDYKTSYATDLQSSITDGNVAVDGTVVTVTFDAPVDSLFIAELAAQVRVLSITAYGGEGGDIGSGDEPVVPPVDPEPEDPEDPDEPVGGSATIDFTDKANRVSYSTEQQVWAQNGITVTNDKAASTSNVGDYGGEGYPVRFYKSSSVLVECVGMSQIVFNCDDYKDTYATDLAASITDGHVSVDGTVVTVTFDAPVNSLFIAELAAQVRVLSIAVNGGDIGGGDEPTIPDEPVEPSEDTLTIADAIAMGSSMAHNAYTEQKYYVTGVITEVYNEVYGNMYITDGEGNTLTIYGTFSASGEVRYDALEVKPVAGDTVTIYGIVGQYNGTPQIKNGWITEHIPGEGGDEPAPELSVEDAPVAGVAYKFGMVQGNVSADSVYYLTGAMSGYYMATTTNAASAVDVYLEETEGGYYLYTMDEKGTKAYINMVVSGTHVNGEFGAATATTVYTFDTESYTLIAEIDGTPYWFGTRSDMSYTTVGPVKVEYAGFYCQLYA